ncbi:DUF4328 domain-containing protein [Parerythrobacter aestuarii]|uniref:DUF4328 domain-containing protein n=1 Tax=Parerythrobacter aestuarii TaxID=3020909 RepID=UPI0024DDFD7B|nr:DUF4328 domain-containing protein [Parerythrobacter aestuarii]
MSTADAANAGLRMRANFVRVCAWGLAILTVIQIATSGYILFRPKGEIVVTAPGSDPGMAPEMIAAIVVGIVALLFYLLVFVYFVSALVWIHKAHRNLIEDGVRMDHSAGWAVGSWFIPLVNLVVPMRAMRELYNRSHGEEGDLAHISADDVTAWWTALLVGLFLYTLLGLKLAFNMLTNAIIYAPVWAEFGISAFAAILLAVAAVLFSRLADTITTAQKESARVSGVFE